MPLAFQLGHPPSGSCVPLFAYSCSLQPLRSRGDATQVVGEWQVVDDSEETDSLLLNCRVPSLSWPQGLDTVPPSTAAPFPEVSADPKPPSRPVDLQLS